MDADHRQLPRGRARPAIALGGAWLLGLVEVVALWRSRRLRRR